MNLKWFSLLFVIVLLLQPWLLRIIVIVDAEVGPSWIRVFLNGAESRCVISPIMQSLLVIVHEGVSPA